MRRAVLAAALSCLMLAPPSLAGGPPAVHASAFVVESATTNEVLASSNAHKRVPIASITKLMTVLIALDRHKLSDVVSVDPRAAAVGESSAGLDAGDRLTVSDLVKGALIQSANDAADALALSVSTSFPAFAEADERRGHAGSVSPTPTSCARTGSTPPASTRPPPTSRSSRAG